MPHQPCGLSLRVTLPLKNVHEYALGIILIPSFMVVAVENVHVTIFPLFMGGERVGVQQFALWPKTAFDIAQRPKCELLVGVRVAYCPFFFLNKNILVIGNKV